MLILHRKVGNAQSVNGFIRQRLQYVISVEMVSPIRFQVQQAMQLLIGCIMSLKRKQKSQRKAGEVKVRNVLPNRKAYKKARWKRMAYRFDSTVNESKARRWKIMRLM